MMKPRGLQLIWHLESYAAVILQTYFLFRHEVYRTMCEHKIEHSISHIVDDTSTIENTVWKPSTSLVNRG